MTSLSPFTTLQRQFQNIHLGLVDPLPPSAGFTTLLTIIDHFTYWPEVTPLTNGTAEMAAHTFLSSLVSRYGIPDTITTDQADSLNPIYGQI